jgi:hypothetical protein
MNIWKSFRIAVAGASILALVATSAQATVYPGFPINDQRAAFTVEDLVNNPYSFMANNSLRKAVQAGTAVETPEATIFCDEFNQRGCNLDANADLSISSVIPSCGSVVENCIKTLEFVKSDGTVTKANFVTSQVRHLKVQKSLECQEALGLLYGKLQE